MTIQFKLPDIGEGVAEGEIVRWMVAAGDSVEEHQPIVEVMTDRRPLRSRPLQEGSCLSCSRTRETESPWER